jgi:hypothetical protein
LTVVDCRASVATGSWHRVVHKKGAQQLAGSFGAGRAFEQRMPDNLREDHT